MNNMKKSVGIDQIVAALEHIARKEEEVTGLARLWMRYRLGEATIDSGKFRTVYTVVVEHPTMKTLGIP